MQEVMQEVMQETIGAHRNFHSLRIESLDSYQMT
jgi:hypothetical protein